MFPQMHSRLLLICCVIYSVIWPSSAKHHHCGQYERPVKCIDQCQTCEYKDGGCAQPAVCIKGCDCIPGFFRNKQNHCIPAALCPNKCKSDEQYYPDIPDCKNTCENYNNPGAICPKYFAARPGCFCKKGLVKRKDGKCVKPEDCCPPGPPQQCPAGEIPVKCIDRCQRCEYKNGNCTQIGVCTPGCNCVPGFLRDRTNKCIPADFCPGTGPGPVQQCPAGEIPVGCIDRCQRCEYKNGNCAQIQVCTPGCNCVPGFLRDSTNKCIPADFCPGTGPGPAQQCPAGEIPVKCVDRCQRCEYKNGNCAQAQVCTPGCNCVPGFLRDKTNKCIPADFCPAPAPAQQCGQYEIPVKCIDQCQTCKYKNGGCAQPAVCIPGCNCIPGFFRNEKNQCVPAASCPGQCKSDEEYYPDIPDCKNTCENVNNPGAICPKYFAPRPGCFCKKGLVKRKDGKCVKPEDCGPPGFPCSLEADAGPCYAYIPRFYFNKKTGECEKFIYGGCKGNANNFVDKKLCELVCKGTRPGPAQQCPAGEIPVGCIDRCQRCEFKNVNCFQIQVCTPGCNCVPGFLRDSTNKCIPANFCPAQCKSDEEYYPDIPDCKNTCENINNPGAICPQYFAPRPGCFCKKGLVKRKDGKCVKPEDCGPPGFPCSLGVDAGPCDGYFPRFYFNKKTGECQKFIYGGCKGNANNFVDKKICEIVCKGTGPGPAQQCPAGEIPVKCIDRCQRCEYKNGNCSQIQVCTPGCNCVPGFLRDSTNKCIPADFCPGPPRPQQCPAGEIPVKCIDRCQRCEYKNGNCSQIQVCTPGCNCVPGFLRDSTNKCIPANFCPEDKPNKPCLQEKDPGPCKAYIKRFYYNKKTGKCEEFIYGGCKGNANNFEDKKICELVCKGPPRPQQCPAGEIPVKCIDRCQRCEYKNGNCSQIQVCTPGCNCVPGFLRDSTNKCIPADFCPEDKPNKPCLQEKDPGPCTALINRFYYNKKTGKCEEFIYGGCKGNANNFVDKKLCELVCKGTGPGPAQQCPAYEYPVPCIDRCQTCEYKNGHCTQTGECTPGCNCIPGFLRDKTKKCIPASRCP